MTDHQTFRIEWLQALQTLIHVKFGRQVEDVRKANMRFRGP